MHLDCPGAENCTKKSLETLEKGTIHKGVRGLGAT